MIRLWIDSPESNESKIWTDPAHRAVVLQKHRVSCKRAQDINKLVIYINLYKSLALCSAASFFRCCLWLVELKNKPTYQPVFLCFVFCFFFSPQTEMRLYLFQREASSHRVLRPLLKFRELRRAIQQREQKRKRHLRSWRKERSEARMRRVMMWRMMIKVLSGMSVVQSLLVQSLLRQVLTLMRMLKVILVTLTVALSRMQEFLLAGMITKQNSDSMVADGAPLASSCLMITRLLMWSIRCFQMWGSEMPASQWAISIFLACCID